jgi:hypothetical protein
MTVPKKGKDRRRARAKAIQLERFRKETAAVAEVPAEEKDKVPRCSFCGKSHNEVKKLIGAPKACICNECLDICNEILADDQQSDAQD